MHKAIPAKLLMAVDEKTTDITVDDEDGYNKVSAVATYCLLAVDEAQATWTSISLRHGGIRGAGEGCKVYIMVLLGRSDLL
jgi:hypothetical protein